MSQCFKANQLSFNELGTDCDDEWSPTYISAYNFYYVGRVDNNDHNNKKKKKTITKGTLTRLNALNMNEFKELRIEAI